MGELPDRQALDRLVTEHLPEVLAFAIKLTGSADEAEEIVQVALVKAAASIGSFRGEAKLKTWLLRIVINAFHDSVRGRTEYEPMPEELEDVRRELPGREMERREIEKAVGDAVSKLPARQREVVILRVYEGMEFEEIAAVLAISPANVRKNLQLGRDRLRKTLGKLLNETSDAREE